MAQSGKALADTREQNAAVKNTNKNLTATGTWQGDGANSYKGKADEIGRNLAKHGDAVDKMKNAMKTVLARAEALDVIFFSCLAVR